MEPVAVLHIRRFYAFGPFRLDPANRLLFRDGKPVRLTPKAFDLLLYFAEHSDRLLAKDDILKSVWPDSFVEEGNLARHVSMLRRALLEGPRDHAYIVTVPGRGYRFVAHVSTISDHEAQKSARLYAVEAGCFSQDEAVADAIPTRRPGLRSRLNRPPAAALVLVFGTLVLLLLLLIRPAGSVLLSSSDSLRLEWRTNTGDVYAPAISPDGAYMAYCWITPEGQEGLRVRQVAGGATIDVVPPAAVWYWAVRFSPKGDFIYYVIADGASNPRGTLLRVPTLGGRSEELLENVSGGIAAGPDGQSLAFVRLSVAPQSAAIMTVSSAGGEPRTLVSFDGPSVVQSVDWSPDGRELLYAVKRREASGVDSWHVAEIDVSGGSPGVIVPPRSTAIIAAAWLPDRRGILMSAADPQSGMPQLWQVSYPDGIPRRLTDDFHNYKDLTVSADGATVVTQILGHLVQLWVASASDPVHARQIGSGTVQGAYDALAWTSDNQLLYRWRERGVDDVWTMPASGNARRPLTANVGSVSETAPSRRGRLIFFVSTRSGSSQIWRMNSDGNDLRQLTHLPSSALHPVASPDGRWVYFTADESGVQKLWRVDIEGQSINQVWSQQIDLFDLSPDGKSLAYSYRDPILRRTRVRVVDLGRFVAAATFDIEPTFALRWTPDGKGLGFTHGTGNIWIQPLNGTPPYALTLEQPGFKTVAFAWSSDGQYLSYTVAASPVDAIGFTLVRP